MLDYMLSGLSDLKRSCLDYGPLADSVEHNQAVGGIQYTGGLESDLGLDGRPA